jgi:hypothetical protein
MLLNRQHAIKEADYAFKEAVCPPRGSMLLKRRYALKQAVCS